MIMSFDIVVAFFYFSADYIETQTKLYYQERVSKMKKLEIITRPEKLEDVKEVMNKAGIFGMTVSMVSGCGLQKGIREVYRGTELNINLLPKVKIETVVKDEVVESLIEELIAQIKTGQIGDGKIFIYDVENVIKIRTGESGVNAI